MPYAVLVDNKEVLIGLDQFKAAAADKPALLRIAGELMRASIARTFKGEGSPAGSWVPLAVSTMLKKGYSAGHKLLILSGRLFGSIGYQVSGDTLTIGTNLVYAAVQQFGSADRAGAAIGPQARIPGRAAKSGRFQNIPPRPYVVFRPEDPDNIVSGFTAFLARKAAKMGTVSGGFAGGLA